MAGIKKKKKRCYWQVSQVQLSSASKPKVNFRHYILARSKWRTNAVTQHQSIRFMIGLRAENQYHLNHYYLIWHNWSDSTNILKCGFLDALPLFLKKKWNDLSVWFQREQIEEILISIDDYAISGDFFFFSAVNVSSDVWLRISYCIYIFAVMSVSSSTI